MNLDSILACSGFYWSRIHFHSPWWKCSLSPSRWQGLPLSRIFSGQFPEEIPQWLELVKEIRVMIIMTQLWLLSFRHGCSSAICYFYPIYFSSLFLFFPLIFHPNSKAVSLLYVCEGHNGTKVFLQATLKDKIKLKCSALKLKAV